jgi:hypothetical protein
MVGYIQSALRAWRVGTQEIAVLLLLKTKIPRLAYGSLGMTNQMAVKKKTS